MTSSKIDSPSWVDCQRSGNHKIYARSVSSLGAYNGPKSEPDVKYGQRKCRRKTVTEDHDYFTFSHELIEDSSRPSLVDRAGAAMSQDLDWLSSRFGSVQWTSHCPRNHRVCIQFCADSTSHTKGLFNHSQILSASLEDTAIATGAEMTRLFKNDLGQNRVRARA